MEKPYILHMFTPEKNLSPFDVNMALDAGWTSAIPYLHVESGEIQALVQDAIFSRSPGGLKRTGIVYWWPGCQDGRGHGQERGKSHGAAV